MMERQQQTSPEAGFTLIEALIATFVLMVGLAGVARLYAVAGVSNSVGNISTATAAQATDVLEQLKAIPFTSLAPGGSLTADQPGTNNTPNVSNATYNVY